jgi:hypothetical protein
MAANVIQMPARRRAPKPPVPRAFETVSVHLESIAKGKGSEKDRKIVAEEIVIEVERLERYLADGGREIRDRVTSYVNGLASGCPDPVSAQGVRFTYPAGGKAVTVGDGEAGKPSAERKLRSIIPRCIEAAQSDLHFLRGALPLVITGGIPPDKLRGVREILGKNSYMRYFEVL